MLNNIKYQGAKRKIIIVLAFSICSLLLAAFLFWQQELQYLLPTPKPERLVEKPVGSLLLANFSAVPENEKPLFLHFFNPDCPCSRFNLDHVRDLVSQYRDKADFVAVIQSSDSAAAIKGYIKTNLDIPYILDLDGVLADSCGVYATPQAVLLTPDRKLFYRGNYNTSRYCTNKQTQFAKIALDSLLQNGNPPYFIDLTPAYGCQLPSDITPSNAFFTIFK
jgi:hypothetical protein